MNATIEQSGVWDAGRDEATYRGDSLNSVSSTEMECFRKNPEKYRAHFIDRTLVPDRTTALAIGGGLHTRVLLPGDESISEIPEYCLSKNGARNTRGDAWKQFETQNAGKTFLKANELGLIDAMRDRLLRHKHSGPFLRAPGEAEVPIKATHPETGLPVRCRIDWLTEDFGGGPVIIDLKTYGRVVDDLRGIANHIERYGYARQAAFYRMVYAAATGRIAKHLLVFIETSPPHRVLAVELSQDWLNWARLEVDEAMARLSEARETGRYETPGLSQIVRLDRPRWTEYADEYATVED